MGFDEWMSPPDVIELGRTAMGSIDFDPASNFVAQEYVRAKYYCTRIDEIARMNGGYIYDKMYVPEGCLIDGLKQYWRGNVWCNPPYSAGNIDRFVDKAVSEWERTSLSYVAYYPELLGHKYITQMILLVNSATDTKWYHKLLNTCNTALLWQGRIKFWKIENGVALEKWEGQKSKERGLGKIGNSPRYLNTLFYFGSEIDRFKQVFKDKGTFVHVSRV